MYFIFKICEHIFFFKRKHKLKQVFQFTKYIFKNLFIFLKYKLLNYKYVLLHI